MSPRINIVLFVICFFCFQFGWSQANVAPNIDAVGDQFYCPLSQINIATSFDIVDPDDISIDVFNIQISTGYQIGQDQLILTGSHPNIVSTWNTTEGKLTLRGNGGFEMLYTDLIAAVLDVVFQNSSLSVSGEKYFSFNIGDANYLPLTDHYYEYIPYNGISWTDARNLAATFTYYGLQGYLATLIYPEEAQLTGEQAASTGWIGGSDAEIEGVWKWVTGPEAGLIFWNGLANGSSPNYANWNVGEPNQFNGVEEDYAHITDCSICQDGSWNDLPNEGSVGEYFPRGFVVEYGGMPGDPVVDISASTRIKVPSIVSKSGDSRCGDGSLALQAISDSGTVIWFDTLTAGNQLATGNTFITPSINATTTFYTLPSINGCLEGVRTPVTATVYEIPQIISITEDLVCFNGSGQLFATTSSGEIHWYENAIGGPIIGIGSAFTTPVLSLTTTYYVDAEFNGCITSTRMPVTVTVQQVATPTANSLQTFCDIENATISDLIISGSNINWYNSDVGGNRLALTDELTSTSYYATQTLQGCESPLRLEVTVIIYETVEPLLQSQIPDMANCDDPTDGDDTNGFLEFNLTLNEIILLNGKSDVDFQFYYFTDAAYANQIMNPIAFVNSIQGGQTIYVRIENILDTSCYTDAFFNIQVEALPIAQPSIIFKNCDEDGISDGFTDYNLNEANDVITNGNSTDVTITYYLTASEAESGLVAIDPVPYNNATASTVYARVENGYGCYRVTTVNLEVSTTSFPLGYMQELENCDDDDTIDGLHTFDLSQASSQFINQFPVGQNLTVHYYRSIENALIEENEILQQENYINEIPFSQQIYVRVESNDNGECFGIGPHLILTVHPRPEFEVDQSEIYCLNDEPINLFTFSANGNYAYEWTDVGGIVVSNLPTAVVTNGGTYTVIAISSFGCDSFPISFTVLESSVADIENDDVTIVELSDNNSIAINNSNNNLGIGDYEFSLDDISGPYQDEPFFGQIGAGVHTIYVQDKNGCDIAELEVFVMGFPKFFTPNNDRYNDTWNIKGLSNEFTQNSTVYIYDRYGKLIKQINPRAEGWDGTFNGQQLRTSDYWFVVQLENVNGNTTTYRGHFSLIR